MEVVGLDIAEVKVLGNLRYLNFIDVTWPRRKGSREHVMLVAPAKCIEFGSKFCEQSSVVSSVLWSVVVAYVAVGTVRVLPVDVESIKDTRRRAVSARRTGGKHGKVSVDVKVDTRADEFLP